ncbi:MAG TPA: PQQ-binding-like beta-propeller repeat protein [Pyrinomonadaceae bacterium]|jgi:eukaryotic-like serine/threonine-protein kinase|nr:PQQ-binding-like beta-propeller repeat protein [Pyrinomonadaceae bacterium]
MLPQILTLFLITTLASSDALLSQPLTVRWRYESPVTLNLTPAFDNERIYLPLAGGTIVALKAKDGQLFWRTEVGGELSASPVADESSIYVASETKVQPNETQKPAGALRALGREGGVTQWMSPLVRPLRGALTLSGGKIFAGGSDGRAYAFDKRTGGVLWSIPFALVFSGQPVVNGGRVYLGSEDGTLLALDEATGRLLWRYRTKGAIHGPVAVNDDTVFFGSGDNYVYALSADKGKMKWQKRTGAGVESVVLAGESLLAASLDNFAYLLNHKGKMLWKKLLPGRIAAQPLAVQETALFTPLSSSEGVVLGLKDGKQVNTLVAGEELSSSASPIIVGDTVIVTTEHGLLAFARPTDSASKPNHD